MLNENDFINTHEIEYIKDYINNYSRSSLMVILILLLWFPLFGNVHDHVCHFGISANGGLNSLGIIWVEVLLMMFVYVHLSWLVIHWLLFCYYQNYISVIFVVWIWRWTLPIWMMVNLDTNQYPSVWTYITT